MSNRILIVEDDEGAISLYQRVLMGYEQMIAENMETALDLLEQHEFDLVILDIYLPEPAGISILEYIRAYPEFANTHVVVITSDELQRQSCETIGVEGFMTKPIQVAELVNWVDNILAA